MQVPFKRGRKGFLFAPKIEVPAAGSTIGAYIINYQYYFGGSLLYLLEWAPKPYSKYEGPYITWEFLQFGSLIKLQVLLSGLRLFRVTDDGFRDSVLGLITADGHNPHLTLGFCICLGLGGCT